MSAPSAFDRLAPRVQRWVWQQGWTELRDIQVATVEPILAGRDVVIASTTASGKAEAAFLPICSAVAESAATSLAALYLSPLKALINDQERRLISLFETIDAPVTPWHGDIAAQRKRRLVASPAGLLLLTPESLEALFIQRGSALPRLFAGLRYVVVDELHAFLDTERGRQLQSLLHRLEAVIGRRVPRVGLSATLGDLELASAYLRPDAPEDVVVINSTAMHRAVHLQIRGYRETALASPGERDEEPTGVPDTGDAYDIARDLYAVVRGGTHLAFANSRGNVERYTDLLKRLRGRDPAPVDFHAHHGSLSRELREDAEAALRANRSATIVATTTLELGIDVGQVDSIAQIGVPPSVSTLRQRLGRSGRVEGQPSVVRVYIQEPAITPLSSPLDQLRPRLVQAVAMVNLLVVRWVEPPAPAALHLSTLVQQVLSVIAQRGGVDAGSAYALLCATGPFRAVSKPAFAQLLRDLGTHDLIAQQHDGTIVLGLRGERLVNHFDFYAAFTTTEEWRLVARGRPIGTMPVTAPLQLDSHLIFGGQRWKIVAVDEEQRTIELVPSQGGVPPAFTGEAALVHDRVRAEMLAVYRGSDEPAFLNAEAKRLLAEGRAAYAALDLDRLPILRAGRDTLVFPWAGDRALDTLVLQLRQLGFEAARESPGLRVGGQRPGQVHAALGRLARTPPPSPVELASRVANLRTQKHHVYLSRELLALDFASSRLDPAGAHAVIAALAASPRPPDP